MTSFNLFDPAFKQDPYVAYAQLRERAPIQQLRLPDGQQVWAVTRYADVSAVLRDERFGVDFNNALSAEQIAQLPAELREMGLGGRSMLVSDPPDHTRLRALVSKAFTPRVVERLRPRIQGIADALLDAARDASQMDLIEDYAFPLPIVVITELLGVPTGHQHQFRAWSDVLVSQLGSFEANAERQRAASAFFGYLRQLIAERRGHPADDLISGLIAAEEQGDRLSETELMRMILLLLVAGHETTVNLIGNGVLAVLRHPDQLAQLRDNPELIKSAIEELLRFTNPVQTTFRFAREDTMLAGQPIRRGERVMVVLAAADRDAAQFADAASLQLARDDSRHLAFGQGIHYCLGAPLARVEGQIAIATLLRRLPGLRLAVDPAELQWRPGFVLRGLQHLPVEF